MRIALTFVLLAALVVILPLCADKGVEWLPNSSAVPQKGLVGLWSFGRADGTGRWSDLEPTAGGQVVHDYSGNNNDFQVGSVAEQVDTNDSGDLVVGGRIVAARGSFATDDYLLSTITDMSGTFTVVVLFNKSATGSTQYILGKDIVGSRGWCFGVDSANKIRTESNGGAGQTGNVSLSAATWYVGAATFAGTINTLYVNGAVDKTGTIVAVPPSTGAVNVGRRAFSGAENYFTGSIAAVLLYSPVALTGGQIARLYRLLYRKYTTERGITMAAPVAGLMAPFDGTWAALLFGPFRHLWEPREPWMDTPTWSVQ